MQDFARILEESGGTAARPEAAAQLRAALAAELRRGAGELEQPRSGYETPLTVAFADGQALLPVPEELRADPGAASERAWLLAAAATGALIEAGGADLLAGAWEGHLVLAAAGADPELGVIA